MNTFFLSSYYHCWSLSDIFWSKGSFVIISSWEGNNPDKGIHVLALIVVGTKYSLCSLKSDTFIILFFLKSNIQNGSRIVQSLWNLWRTFFFLEAFSDSWLVTCLCIWSHLWNVPALPCNLLQPFHLICLLLPFFNLAVDINLLYFKILNWKTKVLQSTCKMISYNTQIYDCHYHVNISTIFQVLASKILRLKIKVVTLWVPHYYSFHITHTIWKYLFHSTSIF